MKGFKCYFSSSDFFFQWLENTVIMPIAMWPKRNRSCAGRSSKSTLVSYCYELYWSKSIRLSIVRLFSLPFSRNTTHSTRSRSQRFGSFRHICFISLRLWRLYHSRSLRRMSDPIFIPDDPRSIDASVRFWTTFASSPDIFGRVLSPPHRINSLALDCRPLSGMHLPGWIWRAFR